MGPSESRATLSESVCEFKKILIKFNILQPQSVIHIFLISRSLLSLPNTFTLEINLKLWYVMTILLPLQAERGWRLPRPLGLKSPALLK